MKASLEKLVRKVIREYCEGKKVELPDDFTYDLVVTKDPARGDFSVNAAFKLAGRVRARPAVVADELVLLIERAMEKDRPRIVERVEVAGNGFINFYLVSACLAQILVEVCKKKKQYGKGDFGKGKKVLLEYVSANPTGPLTIAHGRQAAVGDSLARILKATGHEVTSEYYLNDSGRQMDLLGQSLWARYQDELGMTAELPEDGYQGAYLVGIAKELVKKKADALLKEEEAKALELCREFASRSIMEGIKRDLQRIRAHFDHFFSEGTLYKKNAVEEALKFLREKGFLYEKDGALWFKSTQLGDDKDRVVRKSTGDYTYLAPDIAYHRDKYNRGFNRLINFWGPDHHGYIARLKAACRALGHNDEEIQIRIVQLTSLFRKGEPVRMSTRAGEFVTLRELMDEVGEDATRFFFVMRRVESHLDFDLELAREKSQENPVYYLQYAHARIASLLKFAKQEVTAKVKLELLATQEEMAVIKMVSEFPKALVQASEWLEPYRLADYLRDLATSFHKFYSAHRIVSEDAELTKARLLLAEATRIVMANGLEILGVSQPESM